MPLAAIGFLCLFLELAFIRWMPANMFALAYFSNTVLIASFLGLGLGFLLADRRRDLFAWFVPCVIAVLVCSYAFRFVFVFMAPPDGDLLWNFYYVDNWLKPLSTHMGMLPALACAFVLTAAPFVLIGQKTALLMRGLAPLRAYSLNTLGGFFGIVAFAVLSFLGGRWGTPFVWFLVVAIVGVALSVKTRITIVRGVVAVTCMGVLLLALSGGTHKDNWSPYYNITVTAEPDTLNVHVFVNRFLHQIALNFAINEYATERYDLAYALVEPKNVLILGAGTGNDVATAVRNGAQSIHAVEIDPLIANIGIQTHPDAPYQNPNVQLTIDDARSFLRNTDEQYDMIVFGTLDSHALLSGLSTVRVENFVYTREAFIEARKHLTPDGVAVIMYSAPQEWLAEKVIQTAVEAFGDPQPLLHHTDDHFMYNLMVVAGPGVQGIVDAGPLSPAFVQATVGEYADAVVPTDDWPYLYLLTQSIPVHYLKAAALLMVLSLLGVWMVVGNGVRTWNRWPALQFFCLGAAFLLLETKSVTSLSLLFGSTWLVNAFVFGSITLMIFAGTVVAHRYPVRRVGIWYAALGLALLLNYLVPTSAFLALPEWARFTTPALMTALPLLFASLLFSLHIKTVRDIPFTMGMNLMGVVFGGLLEYTSMLTGLRFLYVVAALLYLGAFLAYRTGERQQLT